MARVVRVIEQVIEDACDACAKKGVAKESTMEITLAGKTWFMCEEHENNLALQLVGLLGDPNEGGAE
jgi:hypothetical protein